jgi:hypothetical protein
VPTAGLCQAKSSDDALLLRCIEVSMGQNESDGFPITTVTGSPLFILFASLRDLASGAGILKGTARTVLIQTSQSFFSFLLRFYFGLHCGIGNAENTTTRLIEFRVFLRNLLCCFHAGLFLWWINSFLNGEKIHVVIVESIVQNYWQNAWRIFVGFRNLCDRKKPNI